MEKTDKVELYVIKDTVADDIGPVYQAKNVGVALRQYRQLLQNSYNPQEYELWRVGYFENMTLVPSVEKIDTSLNNQLLEVVKHG